MKTRFHPYSRQIRSSGCVKCKKPGEIFRLVSKFAVSLLINATCTVAALLEAVDTPPPFFNQKSRSPSLVKRSVAARFLFRSTVLRVSSSTAAQTGDGLLLHPGSLWQRRILPLEGVHLSGETKHKVHQFLIDPLRPHSISSKEYRCGSMGRSLLRVATPAA